MLSHALIDAKLLEFLYQLEFLYFLIFLDLYMPAPHQELPLHVFPFLCFK